MSRVRGPHARFCEKDKGPVSYWALALLSLCSARSAMRSVRADQNGEVQTAHAKALASSRYRDP